MNQHLSWGAQYVSGFTGLTIGSGVIGNATNTFSLVGGTIRDEELYHVLSNPQTTARIGYKNGAATNMKWDAAGATYAILNSGAPRYDNAGTLTDIPTTGGGRYGIMWVYATSRKVSKVAIVVGQGAYNTVALAQAAAQPTLHGMSTAEWKLLYRVIIRNVGGALQWIQSDTMYNLSAGPPVSAGAVTTISAGNVSYNPSGNIVASNVQAAIEELDTEKQAALTFGIADNNAVEIDDTDAASGQYAKFTSSGIEGRTGAQVLSDIGAQPAGSYPTQSFVIAMAVAL
jgi:hypothetical protein